MMHSGWISPQNYSSRLYANQWFSLFSGGNDARVTLSWSNRLTNLPITNIYNFYSSGEEVLRRYAYDPPSDFLLTELEARPHPALSAL